MSKKAFTIKKVTASDYDWFEDFDPFKDDLPEGAPPELDNIISRSIKLLSKRDKEEISAAINAMHNLSMNLMFRYGEKLSRELPKSRNITHPYLVSEALINCKNKVELTKITGMKNMPTWSELYAAYAIKLACECLEYWKQRSTSNSFEVLFPESIINAMVLVSIAEVLKPFHTAGKKGGMAKVKFSQFDSLKVQCHALWLEKYHSRSARDAAKRIMNDLSKDERNKFRTPTPEVTIQKWIGSWKKERPATRPV